MKQTKYVTYLHIIFKLFNKSIQYNKFKHCLLTLKLQTYKPFQQHNILLRAMTMRMHIILYYNYIIFTMYIDINHQSTFTYIKDTRAGPFMDKE